MSSAESFCVQHDPNLYKIIFRALASLDLRSLYKAYWARKMEHPAIQRLASGYEPLRKYRLTESDQKHYQQQYGDLYFLRLAKLKSAVEHVAEAAWANFEAGRHCTVHLPDALTDFSRWRGRRQRRRPESWTSGKESFAGWQERSSWTCL